MTQIFVAGKWVELAPGDTINVTGDGAGNLRKVPATPAITLASVAEMSDDALLAELQEWQQLAVTLAEDREVRCPIACGDCAWCQIVAKAEAYLRNRKAAPFETAIDDSSSHHRQLDDSVK